MADIILTHPALGDRPFKEDVAKRLMAKPNNGGWEFKPKATRNRATSLKDNDAANDSTDKGLPGETLQEGRDIEG